MPTCLPHVENLHITAGQRIRVTQSIVGRDRTWSCQVEGTVQSCKVEPTGSWYAHGKNDKLWLLRLRLRKDDGELTALILDANSKILFLDA